MASYLIQFLKDHPAKLLAWITKEHPKVLRGFCAFVAALTAVGITFSFEAGVLTVTGLTIAALSNFIMTGVSQFVLQHSAFRLLIRNRTKTFNIST